MEFDELIHEVEKIIKAFESIPYSDSLPEHHAVALPAIAFIRLRNKLANYKRSESLDKTQFPRGKSPLCICGEINARHCPVHGV